MQTQYVKYGDPLKSWTQNLAFLGPLMPGRYSGFDTLITTTTWGFQIGTANGLSITDFNFTPLGPWGMYVTKQGCYIQENDVIRAGTTTPTDFTIPPNSSGPFTRYDLLVANHSYVPGTGPQGNAVYSIIPGDSTIPSAVGPFYQANFLPDAPHQTVLGCIVVPVGVASIGGCTWLPAPIPDSGTYTANKAGLKIPNAYSSVQLEGMGDNPVTLPYVDPSLTAPVDGFWELPALGNTFLINPSSVNPATGNPWQMYALGFTPTANLVIQDGLKIRLIVQSDFLQIVSEAPVFGTPTGILFSERGYLPILIPPYYANTLVGGLDSLQRSQSGGPGGSSQMIITLEVQLATFIVQNVEYTQQSKSRLRGAIQFDIAKVNSANVNALNPTPVLTTLTNILFPWVNGFGVLGSNIYNSTWCNYNPSTKSITATRDGLLGSSISAQIAIRFTPGSSPQLAQSYGGPGNVGLMLTVIRAATPGTPEVYTLDEKLSVELLPWSRGNNSSFTPSPFLVLSLKGNKNIYLLAGDIIYPSLQVYSNDAGVSWEWISNTGSTKWDGEFFGSDLAISL